jgi:hypothetical protein
MRAKNRIIKTILIFFLVGLVIQILFDPLSYFFGLSDRLQARAGLPAARKKWESQNITHYAFDIQGYVPLACVFGGNIEVKDGIVIHTGPRSDSLLEPGLPAVKEPSLCNAQIYTMPQLFDELERWLRESPRSVSEIAFDAKYGFISRFGFGSPGGWGLLSPRVSDCCGGFSIENFQVLDE